ncbi:2-C-methyl-D-erythritol 4-phosphate cytidylyltransferase [Tamilnaduibacter salinus]|uniref:2-C-methyl-D-erythritol 4-phosphate cytidylyltransferase n=1 Tax=Tamilnaduibacter salinus TaxID=1484056 RepID=A0A2U1CT56_9GAMM|nr:2-C-methyl-D-erythritol 4-phosphate cytidylyltransferase [Tamilnaduibacter salinus]PVY69622.1 2-C-methyl-D-erythritol 4-phosphate cytidylyltransferase [Tamilnaduibacter salinus]
MPDPLRYWLVIPAAGAGRRMGAEQPKQYLPLGHRRLLDVTLQRLLDAFAFEGCMVALDADDRWWSQCDSAADERVATCVGGVERADSVLAALDALADWARPDDWVLVHDVARPCLARGDLERLISTLGPGTDGGLLAVPVSDTVKQALPGGERVSQTMDRSTLWRAMTPQQFRYQPLQAALRGALRGRAPVTDESSAMEAAGYQPRLIPGRSDNLKVTVPEDLALAEWLLTRLEAQEETDR